MKKKYIAFGVGLLIIAAIVVFANIFLIKSVDVVFVAKPKFADEDSIIHASKISLNTNIFNLDDKEIEKNIASIYDDNSLQVLNIERVFPNKVRIHVNERKPILIVPYMEENGKKCIPTDIDFQMVKVRDKQEINYPAILIKGAFVTDSFNIGAFRQINKIMKAFKDLKFTEDGMTTFIKEIVVGEDHIRVVLRHGDCVFELERDEDIYNRTLDAYNKFLSLDYADRTAFHINA